MPTKYFVRIRYGTSSIVANSNLNERSATAKDIHSGTTGPTSSNDIDSNAQAFESGDTKNVVAENAIPKNKKVSTIDAIEVEIIGVFHQVSFCKRLNMFMSTIWATKKATAEAIVILSVVKANNETTKDVIIPTSVPAIIT